LVAPENRFISKSHFMAVVTADRFVELVKKSQLAEPDRIDGVVRKICESHQGSLPSDVVELANLLQREKVITAWHTEKLLQGKYKGFFLGKYKLLGHIGSGGMSSVYLAEHTKMHDYRAIKVLPPSKLSKSSYLARFQQEAKAIASLNHPNIVRAYDIDNQGDTHYIVMEFVDGEDLQTIVKKKGPIAFELVADYVAQAARGLQHAHDCGLIHRDVKPANVLIRKDGRVKLLDLGLALFTDEDKASLTIDHNDKVLGTADYLAPEQALNSHGVDHRADLYGLGCTMYYMLTGSPPFPEGSIAQRIAKHQKVMPTEIRKLRPQCPGELEGICWKLMQKEPKYRYASAAQTAEVLEAWLAKHRVLVTTSGSGSSSGVGASPTGSSSVRLGDESEAAGERSSARAGSALTDTLSNRGSDTLSGRSGSQVSGASSGSIITNLSTSDSGVLVRLANSPESSSQIDLQAESRPAARKQPSSVLKAPGGKPAPRGPANHRLGTGQPNMADNPNSAALPSKDDSLSPTKIRALWIAGGVILFALAVLLGMVIARWTDSWKDEPSGSASGEAQRPSLDCLWLETQDLADSLSRTPGLLNQLPISQLVDA
jgi:serine/threonine-protein kinase